MNWLMLAGDLLRKRSEKRAPGTGSAINVCSRRNRTCERKSGRRVLTRLGHEGLAAVGAISVRLRQRAWVSTSPNSVLRARTRRFLAMAFCDWAARSQTYFLDGAEPPIVPIVDLIGLGKQMRSTFGRSIDKSPITKRT